MSAVRTIDTAERRTRLAQRHCLVETTKTDDVVDIARRLVALHSSDPVSVYLSATARMHTPDRTAVDRAVYDERALVRHHAMRRTLWVMTPEIARLAHWSTTQALVGPEQRRFAKLLDDNGITTDGEGWLLDARGKVLTAMHALGGPATTRQLGELVPELAIPLAMHTDKSYGGNIGAHTRVMLLLGFMGDVVRVQPTGSWINGQYAWAAMDTWLDGGLGHIDPATAAAALTGAWLRSFGPATTADLQWWTGWSAKVAQRALADAGACAVAIEGGPAWVAADDVDPVGEVEPWVALLPGLDPTVMGWKGRDWYLSAPATAQVFDRNGNAGPTIWVDGRVAGGWVQRPDLTIAYTLFDDVGAAAATAIEAAAHELEQVLGPTRFSVRFPAPMQRGLLESRMGR